MIGQRLGTYTIERKLGDGGMGVVYAATQDGCIRQVAIKVLLADLSRDQTLIQRFFKEVRATTAINHPSIVQVHGFDQPAESAAYIVMELLSGESLSSRLTHSPRLSVSMALTLSRQMATALAAAHDAGIIHRDLKPDNVFVVPDPEAPSGERIKLLDFGIAKLAHDTVGQAGTISGTLIGSPQYMSPEQCEDAGAVDARSDLYSLGCILFQMLSGRPPFMADKPVRLISMHLQTPPPALSTLVPGLSDEVERVVARLLAKSPDERYGSARELEEELVRCGAIAASRPATIHSQFAVAGAIGRHTGSVEARGRRVGLRVGLGMLVVAALGAGLVLGGQGVGCGTGSSSGSAAPVLDGGVVPAEPAHAVIVDARVEEAVAVAVDAAPIDASEPADAALVPARPKSAHRAAQERLEEADRLAKNGDWSTALVLVQRALASGTLDHAERQKALIIAALGACHTANQTEARKYYRLLPSARQPAMRQQCLREGVEPA